MNKKKVTFNEDKNEVYNMVVWNFAYRKAREDIYKFFRLDRLRFQRRIQHAEILLSDILNYNHRCRIYNLRFRNK